MARRYYSSTAVATTLSASANNSTTSITVTALSGFPVSTPWTAIIDPDTASEEVVTVTNVSGTTLTVTRGVDGTSAVSHNSGAVFRHGVSARDFDEANDHVNDSSTDVHPQYVTKALISGTKGALITSTGSAVDDLAPGSNGQVLVADSGATLGLRYVDPPTNRNLIINGAMQVAQRGTSETGVTTANYVAVDRFRTNLGNLGTWTVSQESDGPTGSGFAKSMRWLCTTADSSPAAGDLLSAQYRLEGQDLQRVKKGTASAEQLTLSFWVKSNTTGTYIAELLDLDNSRAVSASYSISASATWERKTITFPADTTGAFDNDNALSLAVNLYMGVGSNFTSGTLATTWASTTNANRAVGQTNLAAATNNYWQITGVQLEVGPVATPFEFEPYEATLRKCQRYYYRADHTGGSNAYGIFAGSGLCTSTTNAVGYIALPQTMRAVAGSIEYGGTIAVNTTAVLADVTAISTSDRSTVNLAAINFTVASGLTSGNFATVRANNSSSAYLGISAEL